MQDQCGLTGCDPNRPGVLQSGPGGSGSLAGEVRTALWAAGGISSLCAHVQGIWACWSPFLRSLIPVGDPVTSQRPVRGADFTVFLDRRQSEQAALTRDGVFRATVEPALSESRCRNVRSTRDIEAPLCKSMATLSA